MVSLIENQQVDLLHVYKGPVKTTKNLRCADNNHMIGKLRVPIRLCHAYGVAIHPGHGMLEVLTQYPMLLET